MSDSNRGTRVPDTEQLARFIKFSGHVRADGTVKSDAWMPPPDLELSVTVHGRLSEQALWDRGEQVAIQAGRTLHGRADIATEHVRLVGSCALDVIEWPVDGNPEHAHVIGWPPAADKPLQKMIAFELAGASTFVSPPR